MSSAVERLIEAEELPADYRTIVERFWRPLSEAIAERYKDGHIERLDGVSADYGSWHFNVRPSNTEPLLRLNLEADSPAMMAQKRDELLELIRG